MNLIQKSAIHKIILFTLFAFIVIPGLSQNKLHSEFYRKSVTTNNTGMYVLGGWAIANMVVGGIGWKQNSGSNRYFHQMNFFWNTVNLSIAGFALYQNFAAGADALTNEMMMQNHVKTERLYLINGGLDLVYIGTGFFLKNLATKKENKKDLLKGYGNSVILQGSFLLVFDAVMWVIQRNHRLQFLENLNLSYNPLIHSAELSFSLVF